jgi:hypothetical protein
MNITSYMKKEKCQRCGYRDIEIGKRCARCVQDQNARYRRLRTDVLAKAKTPEARKRNAENKRLQYQRRREVLLARVKAWAKVNSHKKRAYQSQAHMRIHSNVSRAIRAAIRLNKAGRGWESLVGYTRADLVRHLEGQFTDGMSWGNYGQWEIDHIRPRSSFSFQTAEDPQFMECWELSNLQPLWMSANRSKHAKYEVAA